MSEILLLRTIKTVFCTENNDYHISLCNCVGTFCFAFYLHPRAMFSVIGIRSPKYFFGRGIIKMKVYFLSDSFPHLFQNSKLYFSWCGQFRSISKFPLDWRFARGPELICLHALWAPAHCRCYELIIKHPITLDFGF